MRVGSPPGAAAGDKGGMPGAPGGGLRQAPPSPAPAGAPSGAGSAGVFQLENWKMVEVLYTCPGFSSVVGKLGWFGEFGKCWVSNV